MPDYGRRQTDLFDGLYRVTTPYLCAGFVIKDGHVISCAPILRKRFHFWMHIARRVGP